MPSISHQKGFTHPLVILAALVVAAAGTFLASAKLLERKSISPATKETTFTSSTSDKVVASQEVSFQEKPMASKETAKRLETKPPTNSIPLNIAVTALQQKTFQPTEKSALGMFLPAQTKIAELEREITTLFNDGNRIGPEHYARLKSSLDAEASAGADLKTISRLQNMLEAVNPATVSSTQTSATVPTYSVQKQGCISNPTPVFTNHITDMGRVSYIVPPPTMGAGPSLKPHSYIGTNGANVPIYAPIAMTVKNGSHYVGGPYMFEFAASCEVTIRFGHMTNPVDSIKKLLPAEPKSDSRTQELPAVSFAAGDLIGYTTGTSAAGNWDFGVYNSSVSNRYANDPEWNNSAVYTTAVCPFDYFTPGLKEAYAYKFNATILGGNPPHGESFCR